MVSPYTAVAQSLAQRQTNSNSGKNFEFVRPIERGIDASILGIHINNYTKFFLPTARIISNIYQRISNN